MLASRPLSHGAGAAPRRLSRYLGAFTMSGVLRRDVLATVLLGAFAAGLLRKTLLGGGAMLGYDLFTYFFPAKAYAAAALWRGELPLWNPAIFFGAPFLANVQMAVLYPPDLLFAVADFPRAVAVSQWLHLAAGAAGMYALCRWGWGLDATGAAIGGLTFAGGGFFGAHMGHLNQVHAGIWLPWIALCVLRLAGALDAWGTWRGSSRRPEPPEGRPATARRQAVAWLAGGGLAVALQLTAGHTQEAYYSLFAIGLLALGSTFFPPARAPRRWTHLPAFAAVVANGALLAAAQLLPAAELSRLSYRQGGVPLAEAAAQSVERTYILETLLPTFWSLPSQEVTGYVGATALPLVAAALGASVARRQVLALVALTLVALTLALGGYTPVFAYLYAWAPLFSSFRVPGRWLLISTFALAGLAAHGATALRWSPSPAGRERVALGYGLALAAGAALLLFWIWRTNEVRAVQWLPHARVAVLWAAAAFASMALGLVAVFTPSGWPRVLLALGLAVELAFAAREAEYNRPGAPDLYLARPAVVEHLAGLLHGSGGAPPDRVLSIAVEERLDRERLTRAVPAGDAEYLRYASMREALKPNLGLAYGLPTIDGYDGGLLPTADYARFKSLLVTAERPIPHFTLPPQVGGKAEPALLGTLNVRYLLTDGRHGSPGPGWALRSEAPSAAWLYETADVAPRAFLVPSVVVEPDPAAALERLRGLDLRRAAVVDAPPGLPLATEAATDAATRAARVVRYSAQSLELETDERGAALLVLTDTFYPGWRATVDGHPTPIVRANLLFRGVALPGGPHRVRLWFDPLSVKAGLAISAGAIAVNLLALLALGRVRTQRRGD